MIIFMQKYSLTHPTKEALKKTEGDVQKGAELVKDSLRTCGIEGARAYVSNVGEIILEYEKPLTDEAMNGLKEFCEVRDSQV